MDLTAAFDALLDALPDPVVLASTDGGILSANAAFSRVFRWTPDEVVGRDLRAFLESPREPLESCFSRWTAGTSVADVWLVRRRDGDAVSCTVSGWKAGFGRFGTGIVVRLVPDDLSIADAGELPPGRGELDAEILRRRRAEADAADALAARLEVQQRMTVLADATDTLLSSLTVQDVFQAVGALAERLLPADAHAVWHFDEAATAWRVSWHRNLSSGFLADLTEWHGGARTVPFTTPHPVVDVSSEIRLRHRTADYAAEGVRSLLVVPLRIRENHYGTVVAYYRHPTTFGDADLRVATALGNIASAALTTADLYEAQSRSRAAAETAARRARFLARAAEALAQSLDYERTLEAIANLAVPQIADWCAVDIAAADGTVKRVAMAHADPARLELARKLSERYPEDPASPFGVFQVLRTVAPIMIPHITDELVDAHATDADHRAMLRQLGLKSYMGVPLVAQGRAIGALTFVLAESGRRYTEEDLRFAEDVASRAAQAVEKARAYEEARHANQLKDEFLATLSHELRTPLNAILGYTRMLRSGAVPLERHPQALHTIERNATALNQIVEDVLDVSRIVAGKIRLNVQLLDLPAVVQEAVETITPAAVAKGVRVEIHLDTEPEAISGDPDRLQQVVWNLLSNAVKFTPRGGRVEVTMRWAAGHVEIGVSDTGAGIAREFLPHIFERFRQADSRSTREHSGLGLGLAICRHLVELHGGTITVASDGEGHGSSFLVTLPSVRPQGSPKPARAARPPAVARGPAGSLGSLAGLHVLAVDDEPDALSLVSDVLQLAGARVTTASSALAALDALAREKVDAIVSDLAMPGMDGFGLIATLRAGSDPAVRDIPAAALTAYAQSDHRIRALRTGFQMHLTKPIDPHALVAAVRQLANRPAESS